jgi:hypothetical protein
MITANGILARVGGEFVAQGSQQLPPASPQLVERVRKVVVKNVPDLGDVVLTYRLDWYSHGRSKHWHWRVERADLAE